MIWFTTRWLVAACVGLLLDFVVWGVLFYSCNICRVVGFVILGRVLDVLRVLCCVWLLGVLAC